MAHIGRTLFRFGGALLLGASAVAIDNPRPLFAPTPTAPVVIASADIPAGSAIGRTSILVAQWPQGGIPGGAYRSIDSVAGRMTRVAIFKGEAIVPGRLAPSGTAPGFETMITPGKRAFSFRTDVATIAPLIRPNSRVDVLVIVDGARAGDRVPKLFMENMRVLAIGAVPRRIDSDELQNVAVATLEVTPEEGERLAIASTQGTIQLMLRGNGGSPSGTRIQSNPPRASTRRP